MRVAPVARAAALEALRCALCHAALHEAALHEALAERDQVSQTCPGCRTRWHTECRVALGRCPTLGCPSRAGSRPAAPGVTVAPAAAVEPPGILAQALEYLLVVSGLAAMGALGLAACAAGFALMVVHGTPALLMLAALPAALLALVCRLDRLWPRGVV